MAPVRPRCALLIDYGKALNRLSASHHETGNRRRVRRARRSRVVPARNVDEVADDTFGPALVRACFWPVRRFPVGPVSGPDSVQAFGGMLSLRLPTRAWVWVSFGLRTAGRRAEAWLQRGLPSS